ncbi:MAG: hypothetical protein HZA90_19780 [Verrucomicrobia bacterium]|nr:hypothetical protein [Verrucomicrobiota bacterium]
MKPAKRFTLAAILASMLGGPSAAQSLPEHDQRYGPPRTLNTRRAFPEIAARAEWEKRAQQIREQALVSCGLWPMPAKPPLSAKIFGRVERDGYSVEKVCIQTHAGVCLAGNLYRPRGQGPGPFPAVLNPHGHWSKGRLEDTQLGSIAGRCISLARQGMIAFSYDMVGYNDTQFADAGTTPPAAKTRHHFSADPALQLWHISLMGLQTWNSLRALDFLESLSDVDKSRLGCTGASGGGTQTFMLGAIDDRLAAQAPNVMVSHSMQGGCLCENAPGLRVEYSNMELAAVAAPRPQILVAASRDWTKDTMSVEGPALEKIYKLFNAPEKLRYLRLDFDHNYNQPSREQVYGWFGKWLRGRPDFAPIPEPPFQKEPDEALRVFPDDKLPPDAVTEEQFVNRLIQQYRQQWLELPPKNPPLVERYRARWLPAWKHSLQVGFVEKGLLVQIERTTKLADHTVTQLTLGRAGKGDRVPALLLTPRRDTSGALVVLVHTNGLSAFSDPNHAPAGLAKAILDRGVGVLLVTLFQTGELAEAGRDRDYFKDFFTTYNRTDVQERVQDIITACAFAQSYRGGRRVILCGAGRAGLWSLLAAPAADMLIADCHALDSARDSALLAPDLFTPGLRRLGGFEGVVLLMAPNPLLLHNTGAAFATEVVRAMYQDNHVPERYRAERARLSDDGIAQWIARWAPPK